VRTKLLKSPAVFQIIPPINSPGLCSGKHLKKSADILFRSPRMRSRRDRLKSKSRYRIGTIPSFALDGEIRTSSGLE
jgi:hypothetical protein